MTDQEYVQTERPGARCLKALGEYVIVYPVHTNYQGIQFCQIGQGATKKAAWEMARQHVE